MTVCKSCGAPLLWVMTAQGKSMPLDAQSCFDGNIYFDDDERPVFLAKGELPPEGKILYKSHFATCPASTAHRKKQPPGGAQSL